MSSQLDKSIESNGTFDTAHNSSLNTNVSVTSTSDFMVPNKLYLNITQLRTEYIRIVNCLHQNIGGVAKNTPDASNNVELLTSEQFTKACKKVNKPDIVEHLGCLLEHTRSICLPCYKPDSRPKLSPQQNQISDLLAKMECMSQSYSDNFKSVTAELEKLKHSVESFEKDIPTAATCSRSIKMEPIPIEVEPIPITDHRECHIAESIPDYIDTDTCNTLMAAASSFQFKTENGRDTVVFGESYDYNGSRNEPKAMPDCIAAIMDGLNKKYTTKTTPLNSCLVNRYTGPSSFLPTHSDNERCINPQSAIYTISVGHESTIKFKDILSGTDHEHQAAHGSLYSMTRASQEFFKHGIDKKQSLAPSSVRLSLTFRSVHWRNHNSTIILGDSNTGGLKFGTSGRSFRASMPGKREAAFLIAELDPMKCLGYNNIVVSCGLNDIRKQDVRTEEQIRSIYIDFKTKIDHIVRVNKRARVFVAPMLPTTLHDLNIKSQMFNKLLYGDLVQFNRSISIIVGFDQFVASNGCLKQSLLKDDGLSIHINDGGYSILAKCIKQSIFYRKQAHRNRQQTSSRTYSNALTGPPRRS